MPGIIFFSWNTEITQKYQKNIENSVKNIFLQFLVQTQHTKSPGYVHNIYFLLFHWRVIHFITAQNFESIKSFWNFTKIPFFAWKNQKISKIVKSEKSLHLSWGHHILNHCSKFQENRIKTLGGISIWSSEVRPKLQKLPHTSLNREWATEKQSLKRRSLSWGGSLVRSSTVIDQIFI